jgi:putative flippase GtrA
VASSKQPLRVVELPFTFRARQHGQSKLDSLVVLEYLGLLLAKLSGDWLSIRFVLFSLVGSTGLLVHLWVLQQGLVLGFAFDWAQTLAAYAAMTSNFVLNNQLTYRDRRLRGLSALKGLITFYAVCSVGTIANVGVANWVYGSRPSWWLAGTAGAPWASSSTMRRAQCSPGGGARLIHSFTTDRRSVGRRAGSSPQSLAWPWCASGSPAAPRSQMTRPTIGSGRSPRHCPTSIIRR